MVVQQVPTASQVKAIESDIDCLLVLAGPGSGKTFCLIERIRFLIETRHFDPARICAFTFTNKAAGEIAERLDRIKGGVGEKVMRGTIHAFCANLLRENAESVGLRPGFGIADEDYQCAILRRLRVSSKFHKHTLRSFSNHKMRDDSLHPSDQRNFEKYSVFLREKNVLDFDDLVLKAAELIASPEGEFIRSRWDAILVDEFQDLNPVQYALIKDLASNHRHIFAVGDDEQSIFSWAGADPTVFLHFLNDFGITNKIQLEENHRCPSEIFEFARVLMSRNQTIIEDRTDLVAKRSSGIPIISRIFEDEIDELRWIVSDLRARYEEGNGTWGEFAFLYRRHEIGDQIEAALINEGIPSRLAQSRALADEPTVAYLISALRVIYSPNDPIYRDAFLAELLPRHLYDEARSVSEREGVELHSQLTKIATQLPREHQDARAIRKALVVLRNLRAVGIRHGSIDTLVQELLSQRVGHTPTALEEHHDEISDPQASEEVRKLAKAIRDAREMNSAIWIAELDGVGFVLKRMLAGIGCRYVTVGGKQPPNSLMISPTETSQLGIALTVFKAAQLLEMEGLTASSMDFTVVDIEATSLDVTQSHPVELAAVRVREGRIDGEFQELVRPPLSIPTAASSVHGITNEAVASARTFAEVWPEFRKFCGTDMIVAHNGYHFDFPVLARLAKEHDLDFGLNMFDSLPLARDLCPASRALKDLAALFGVAPGDHRALADSRCLANVFLGLNEMKVTRARKTACQNLLEYIGLALALSDQESLKKEAQVLLDVARYFALGRYGHCLDEYARDIDGRDNIPSLEEAIEKLGGRELMAKLRIEKGADDRYPAAMRRLGMLIRELLLGTLREQITVFLERIALSKREPGESASDRVNLLSLHATKGLEFSNVYIVGVESSEFPGGTPDKARMLSEIEESRRVLYVGMTRAKQRLVLTCTRIRDGAYTNGHQFLNEMGIIPTEA
ncbi:MAG: UvrD-helicase domain-containing protein [Gemmatimonadaceae bacterium]|nr:UvrD-helicase domain-containing protein [Gemmatimonadaceae bacterium]